MSRDEHAALLISATRGFDFLFANDIDGARNHFTGKDDAFHQLGLGVCAFLQAALGMEPALLAEANRALSLAEAGSRKQLKNQKNALEWEILSADTVVLLGLTNALSETYMGYLQCMYSLNSAHSKFAKLYKTVFPNGLEGYKTPAASPTPSRHSSSYSVHSTASTSTPATNTGFFSRFTSSGSNLSVPSKNLPATVQQDGPIDELIVSGTAFGYGLFNLVLSLLPKGVQNVVGFFGFKHDRRLALQALAISATKSDVHAVFSGLVLMTYHGVILLMSGYQADEAHIIKQYRAIVDKLEAKYPQGALWILNRAKILRMSNKPNDAIQVLQDGLKSTQGHSFTQADTLLVFELAWTLLGQRRYQEAADMFLRLTELNSWSHATYHFLAAGCYISLGNIAKAQELFNAIPDLISKRKINGKEPPTEVMIKKKIEFYKEKQRRRGGVEAYYAQAIKISPAEELGIFWNTHSRIDKFLAETHIEEWASLTPLAISTVPGINSDSLVGRLTKVTLSPKSGNEESESLDLDTPDEMAIRSLLLGIAHRTIGEFDTSRKYLRDACNRQALVKISTWIGGVSMFELAVLDLKQVEAKERAQASDGSVGINHLLTAAKLVAEWESALKSSSEKLDAALALTTNSTDLSSRLDSRISMLRDEIALKREMLGIS